MTRLRLAVCFAFVAALAAPVAVRGEGADGTWRLFYLTGGTIEQTVAIVKVQTRDGSVTAEMIAGDPRRKGLVLKGVSREGKQLRVTFESGKTELSFEASLPANAPKKVLGQMTIGDAVLPGWLIATDETELNTKTLGRYVDCPPLKEVRTLATKGLLLRIQAQQKKTDAETKKELLKRATDADLAARKPTMKLHREVLDKHADNPAVFDSALNLIRGATNDDAKPDEVKSWAETATRAAAAYGPRWQGEFAAQVALALTNQESVASLALDFARQAERTLTPKSSATEQARMVSVLARALRKAGKEDEAKTLDVRLAKIDAILDREYLAKMPPFKAAPFAGRKEKSDQTVFLELFTGATCPPCVAADLAFDVLTKTYPRSDLVLIQYHLHIPGPDPMANPDTEARWEYYSEAFPDEIRGVPSSIFNGKPAAGSGGTWEMAEEKYQEYRDVIDRLLEAPAAAKLGAQARRQGNRIDIQVEVSGLAGAGAQKKLRILLAEETIRYAGSNRIRFHHNVVRAFPGGVEGRPLTAAASKHQVSIDLGELRGKLVKYLDDYQENVRPFANPARPLDFSNLRVIAIVQDDDTRAIAQAVQVDVK